MTVLVGDLTYIFSIVAAIILLLDSAMYFALSNGGKDFSIGLMAFLHFMVSVIILLGLVLGF